MLTNNTIEINNTKWNFNFWWLLDWIYPPFCCGCQQIGQEICPDCFSSIQLLENQRTCERCGKAIHKDSICRDCRLEIPAFDQLKSWASYQGVIRNIVTGIKYEHRIGLLPCLIESMTQFVADWNPQVDMLVPVPLGNQRLRSRGYNQAALIAKPLAASLRIPYISQALARIRETSSQVGLNATGRKENLKGAFLANPTLCSHKNILLVDDIATTGSTLNECARALKQEGAEKIYCFTLARTNLDHIQINQNWR